MARKRYSDENARRLVHRPALHLQQENDMNDPNGLLHRLLTFLNLPEDTI